MATTDASASEAGPEQVRFERPPIDRLFVGCVLAACAGYGAFLIALQFAPEQPEAEAKQSFMGVVSGESQPPAGPGEADPAEGVAMRGGAGSAHYAGGGRPRPVVLIDGEAGSRGGPAKVEAGELPLARGPVAIGSASGGPAGLTRPLSELTADLGVELSARALEAWTRRDEARAPDSDAPELEPLAPAEPQTPNG